MLILYNLKYFYFKKKIEISLKKFLFFSKYNLLMQQPARELIKLIMI